MTTDDVLKPYDSCMISPVFPPFATSGASDQPSPIPPRYSFPPPLTSTPSTSLRSIRTAPRLCMTNSSAFSPVQAARLAVYPQILMGSISSVFTGVEVRPIRQTMASWGRICVVCSGSGALSTRMNWKGAPAMRATENAMNSRYYTQCLLTANNLFRVV